MSITMQANLFCDGDCADMPSQEPMDYEGPLHMTAEDAREWAITQGWQRDGERDLCPKCAKKLSA